MQHRERDGRSPNGPFEPFGYILGKTKLVAQVRDEIE